MSMASPLDDESLPPNLVLYIDQMCDRFEAALRKDQRPRIENYLDGAPAAARTLLLHELVAVELACDRAEPLPAYQERFPGNGEMLGSLFAARMSTAEKPTGLFALAKGLGGPARLAQAVPAPAAVTVQLPGRGPVPDLRHTPRGNWRRGGLILIGVAATVTVLMLGIAVGWVLRPVGEQRVTPENDESRRLTNTIGMEFALIPAGQFEMGSPPDEQLRNPNEGPQHDVTITRPFFLGINEVTVGQFRAFVGASGYRTEAEANGRGAQGYDTAARTWPSSPERTWRTPGWPQTDDDPVVCVTWNDARAFCEWLSRLEKRAYRLPTEAEWEYACRGGMSTPFGFGTSLSSFQADFDGEFPYGPDASRGPNRGRPVKVGSFQPNQFGINDMHGNVTEWCADYYQSEYPAGPQTDPTGPATGEMRVYRGGSWFDRGNLCRSAMRGKNPPDAAFSVIGFRVACRP